MSETLKNKGLSKAFGLKMAIIMVISAIIGSGVFKKVAPMAELLHSPWLVIMAWLLSGIVILFGVLCIAELSAMFPHAGGPFSWLQKIYGRLTAFLYGWSCFTVIQTAAISSIAFVFAGALSTFVPLPQLPSDIASMHIMGLQPFYNFGAKLVACLLIVSLTLVNIKGTRKGGRLSLVFTFLILLSILIIIGVAFGSGTGSIATMETRSVHYPAEGFTLFTFISAMVLAMRSAFWGYEGWIALGFIGAEVKEPGKNLPRALIIGIITVILAYVLVNAAYLYIMPIDELLAQIHLNENNIAAVLVVDKMLGAGGTYVISAMILISTFGCTNATILVSSRIYYAMGQQKLFFRKAAQTHPKNHTPHYSLIYQCIWACLLVFSGSFDLLTDLVIIAGFIFFGMIVLGMLLLRITLKDVPRPYKAPLFPFIPAFFVLFCIVLISISFYESPVKSLTGLLLIFSGLPFYFYWRRTARMSQSQSDQLSARQELVEPKDE